MKIIGLCGPMGSGKDTVYDILKSFNIVQGKLSFAGPLKYICSRIFATPMEYFEDQVKKAELLRKPIVLNKNHLYSIAELMREYLFTPTVANLLKHEGKQINTLRELLQYVGTEVIRDTDNNWHINASLSKRNLALQRVNQSHTYAFTDVRFFNEFEFLKDQGGEVFYVERPSSEEKLTKSVHMSELSLLDIKKHIDEKNIIKNNGTLEELEDLIAVNFGATLRK